MTTVTFADFLEITVVVSCALVGCTALWLLMKIL